MKNSRKRLGVIGKYIVGAVILALVLLYLLVTPFKSNVNKIVMLFTSKSVESIMGYIRSYGNYTVVASLLLLLFQDITVIFNEILVFLANIKLYGNIVGGVISYLGLLFAAVICFAIAKSLFNNLLCNICSKNDRLNRVGETIESNGFLVVLLLRFIPVLPIGFVNYVSGLLPIKFSSYIVGSLIGCLPKVFMYVVVGKRLTQSQEIVYRSILIGLALVVCVVMFVKRRKDIIKNS